ncbi:DNA replication complex GINS protein PSF2-like [Dysidea avara]|uniref:DNA replication complex GINS protein PSF2-like n=1 Tax=Dysidea avara TaxID=196820 RepID=UPI00331B33FC
MDPPQAEFLAENLPISISPNFSANEIFLISGDFGPFNPLQPVNVPLWLGINLKQRQKCRINPPEWLSVEQLDQLKSDEATSDLFTSLPSKHFFEMANLLLTNASDDIPDCDQVRMLVKDLADIRAAKLRRGIDEMISQQQIYATVTNLTSLEIINIRPFLTAALTHVSTLQSLAAQQRSD